MMANVWREVKSEGELVVDHQFPMSRLQRTNPAVEAEQLPVGRLSTKWRAQNLFESLTFT
jgi:hypothetical protein